MRFEAALKTVENGGEVMKLNDGIRALLLITIVVLAAPTSIIICIVNTAKLWAGRLEKWLAD